MHIRPVHALAMLASANRRVWCRLRHVAGSPLLVVLIGGFLQACTPYQPRPLDAADVAASFEGRSLEDPGLASFLEGNGIGGEWPRRSWELETLTLAAFYFSPELDVSRARWSTSQAALRTAGQRPNPSLSVTPQYNVTSAMTSPWIVTASIDIPIETAGKRGYRIARAQHLSDAARLDIAATAWTVRARLRQALLDLYTATERERLLADQEAALRDSVSLLERQLAAGAISPATVANERIRLDRVLLAAQEVKRDCLKSRVAVARSIGLASGALDGVDISFEGLDGMPPDLDPRAARRRALRNRADVLAALSDYAATEFALRLEIAKQYPDIHLGPGYEFDQGDDKWGVGLTLELPLLNRNQGPIAEAEARRAESAAQFNALQARVLADIDGGFAGYRAAQETLATAEELVAHLDEQAGRLRGRYDAGDITRSELLGSELELLAVRLARVDAVAGAQRSLGELEEALQSPVLLPTDPDLFLHDPRIHQTRSHP